jgi:UDP-3-O-acyl N-acetylglucosamine deacetylase
MSATNQRTLKKEVVIKGVGLHTGRKCRATIKPAAENAGITFVRTDLPGKPALRATLDNVVEVIRGTTLGIGDARVYTIEHILSALNGHEIDNALIELDDNEPPVCDGSAKEFVNAFASVGILDQSAPKKFFTVNAPFEYKANQSLLRIQPAADFELSCEIHYDHPMIKTQQLVFNRSSQYDKEIAPARTYCFDYEIEGLKKKGLAKGGSLDNAIVVGPDNIYNPGTALRFPDEFVRHKTLDLLGDLMLIGQPIKAKITAVRAGHGHNVKFMRELLQNNISNTTVSVG